MPLLRCAWVWTSTTLGMWTWWDSTPSICLRSPHLLKGLMRCTQAKGALVPWASPQNHNVGWFFLWGFLVVWSPEKVDDSKHGHKSNLWGMRKFGCRFCLIIHHFDFWCKHERFRNKRFLMSGQIEALYVMILIPRREPSIAPRTGGFG